MEAGLNVDFGVGVFGKREVEDLAVFEVRLDDGRVGVCEVTAVVDSD